MSDAVTLTSPEPGIALITINRPEQRNALSAEVRAGLYAAWDAFEATPEYRIAILTGAGEKAFCAGGDLKEMVETGLQVPPRDMFPVPYDTVQLSKPTIAAVNGVAFAGGWMIAQGCDLCVASRAARFAITEVKVGRSSPWAAPLIHMIPQRIMMEIILTGKPIDAQRAYEIGLVNRLAEPGETLEVALELAREVLQGAPQSVRAGRETVMLATQMGRSAALEAARHASEWTYRCEDAQEGPRAFAEKRAPVWTSFD
ncbi:enoyl-CoA hydratase/isomerase family protein [Novosphingobium mangrovi (ex Hu et al. 2023)]|uniref:Enoyl-CoA hydratase-related protein n=1 Tax=Novosphingobium mangrovi (ex Hu et al. 2023) TaxID=2930094 RepID=A0ABT0AGL8_9SPHN|nr:enoyl-CoA hydratase-related protein [Novosphingobium mangrovi (ex Hu et al. 2023)]MCJ1962350.1 enoyl-CoA hydratase-related protein [Novosphingobium mangrovi (ex Hu et al. 2023)]